MPTKAVLDLDGARTSQRKKWVQASIDQVSQPIILSVQSRSILLSIPLSDITGDENYLQNHAGDACLAFMRERVVIVYPPPNEINDYAKLIV